MQSKPNPPRAQQQSKRNTKLRNIPVSKWRPKHILISHFYTDDNKGDAALLSVLIGDIKRYYSLDRVDILTLGSISPYETFESQDLYNSYKHFADNRFRKSVLIAIYTTWVFISTIICAIIWRLTNLNLQFNKNLKKTNALYQQTDMVIAVGGGYLRGSHGVRSFYNLLMLLHPFIIARIMNKPTILYTQSIGPFSNKLEEFVSGKVFNACVSLIIAREHKTIDLLHRIGVTCPIKKSTDSGFAFSADPHYVHQDMTLKKKGPVFGMTARKWLPNASQRAYEMSLARLVDHITSTHKGNVVFIPQVTSTENNDDDRKVHRRIFRRIKNKNRVQMIEDRINHHEIKRTYASLDYLIGTRFHSVIFSLTEFVPALAIEYEHKTSGIMDELGLIDWVIKIEEADYDKLAPRTDALIRQGKSYKRQLKSKLPKYIADAKKAIEYADEAYQKHCQKKYSKSGLLKQPFL